MAKNSKQPQKRTYLKQSDVPSASLEEAVRIPMALFDHYGGKPAAPIQVAKALNMAPNGSQIQVLSGAAIAFGLIEGGAQASLISVTDLARRILRPKEEGSEIAARREAILRPRVFAEFLRQYDGSPLPRTDIGQNVLEDMGVPRERTDEVLERIVSSAVSVGFIEEIKGKQYVSLQGASHLADHSTESEPTSQLLDTPDEAELPKPADPPSNARSPLSEAIMDDARRRRVFVTHGKNRALVDPIKKLLEYGELDPVVSVDRQSVSKPVPEKVMDDMRSCGAAIIHVDAEQVIVDRDGSEHVFLNPNVLIEIGAAMAFYGKRFILLVRDGVKLPSNLQGLYEVRYTGDTLDANGTIKMLDAIKDIKNYALPTDAKFT